MTIGAITTGLQTGLTATGAVTPTAGLDTSAITGDWTLFLQVAASVAAKTARIYIESSTDAFTNSTVEMVADLSGAIASASDVVTIPIRKYQKPASVIGTTGAVTRVNVKQITSGNNLSLKAWIEY